MIDDGYSVLVRVGPFTVLCNGNPYTGHYLCWLTEDLEQKILCEGTSRDIGEFFERVAQQ